MTLASRVSAFFLTALAVVLVVFSMTLYWLRAEELDREAEERLASAIATIGVAIEIRDDAVEWEPQRRALFVGGRTREEALPWCVRDPDGHILSRSRPRFSDQFFQLLAAPRPASASAEMQPQDIEWMQQSWRGMQRRFRPGIADSALNVEHSPRVPKQPLPDQTNSIASVLNAIPISKAEADDDAEFGGVFPALVVQVAAPLQLMRGELDRLRLTLAGMSVGTWLLSALVGHWVCRRALRPVSGMAAAAHAIDVNQHQQRLPVSATHDELEELSVAFNGLLDRLHESFERQRRFTGDASHQLRTPLTVMLGQVEVALRRDRTADDYRQTLSVVQRQADQLRHIVELMLFLARADAESQRPDLQRLDLADWLTTHREHWQHQPRIADLRLDIAAESPLWIEAHPALLTQVLNNLVENAFDYSPVGSPVRVHAEHDATHVCLSISDNGCGIPATDMAALFRPFYRSEEARRLRPQGTGLGLAVAHRIVTVLGGDLSAEPHSPRGTTFAIRFPLASV